MTDIDPILDASFGRRSDAWALWGTVEPDVLAHLMNPTFMGGPRWPGLRQAFRVVRRGTAVLVASDGLSDPYDEGEGPENVNGLGLEIFAISSDAIGQVAGSWLFELVWQMSQLAAKRVDISDLLEEHATITTELYDVHIPEEQRARFVSGEGSVGIMAGLGDLLIPRTDRRASLGDSLRRYQASDSG